MLVDDRYSIERLYKFWWISEFWVYVIIYKIITFIIVDYVYFYKDV